MRALEFSDADIPSHDEPIKSFIIAIADQPDAEVEFARIMQHPKVPTQYRPFYEALLSALKREDFDFEKANLALQTGYEDAFILYCLWQEMSQERQAQAVSQIPEDQNQEQEDLVQKTPSESDDDTFSDEDSPEGLEMAGAAAAEGSTPQPEEESQEIQAYTVPKNQREAVKQKTKETTQDAKKNLTQINFSSTSAEPRPSVRITWSEEARADLKTLTQEMGQAFRSDRLPLLLETLKEFQCAGANSIEVLKHAKHNDERIFAGRIDHKHRLCATRTYNNKGNVTGIHLLSLRGHY